MVRGDVLRLRAGDQIPVDGEVVESVALEVDESALTGESEPIVKRAGDDVRSGSAVVAGTAVAVATRVGREAWVHQLVAEAKEFVLATSEIRAGVDRLLQVVSWMIAPLAALLLWSQLRATETLAAGLVSAVAGVVGLVPQGLVLLVSMAMAVAIIRLARNEVVVQELHAVEGLARIDVLCVDKTGTLTTGAFELEEIMPLAGDIDIRTGLATLVAAEVSPTSSSRVIGEALGNGAGWPVVGRVPFSSARKWSGASFERHGTWLLGAPDVLLDAAEGPEHREVRAKVAALSGDAKRVLMVAISSSPIGDAAELPPGIEPVAIVVLSEQLRSDAAEIMEYFARQHVAVKIISGDSAATVSAVGCRLGIAGATDSVDLRGCSTADFDSIVESSTVFGRVLPEQKRELVAALQRQGHTVAMTGDGVNDIPALKKADVGIAVDTATPATKAVAQLVLLDGRFDRLPGVVAEGRRVVANMERVSALFVTKTVYASIFVLAIGLSGSVFPFLPRHMSLVSELTIGAPAFLLSFRAADQPCRAGYLRRVLRFSVPAGVVTAAVTLSAYWIQRVPPMTSTLEEARTASTLVLTGTAFWVLYRLIRPIDRFDLLLLGGFLTVFGLTISLRVTRDFYALDWPPPIGVGVSAAIFVGSVVFLEAVLRWVRPQRLLPIDRLGGEGRGGAS
ncbi:MAG: HAD-IC family P-type ATPase [Acidimicrobiales bacterium]